MQEIKCNKCDSELKPGIAIEQTYMGYPDFPGDNCIVTVSPGGPGKLIKCLKCPGCGWSITMKTYKGWPVLEKIPDGWSIDKTAGAPGKYVFITNGKSVLNGQERALFLNDKICEQSE